MHISDCQCTVTVTKHYDFEFSTANLQILMHELGSRTTNLLVHRTCWRGTRRAEAPSFSEVQKGCSYDQYKAIRGISSQNCTFVTTRTILIYLHIVCTQTNHGYFEAQWTSYCLLSNGNSSFSFSIIQWVSHTRQRSKPTMFDEYWLNFKILR